MKLYIACVISGLISTLTSYFVVMKILDICKSSFRTTFYFSFYFMSSILFFVVTNIMKVYVLEVEENFVFINVMFNAFLFFAFVCSFYIYLFDITKDDNNKRFAKVTGLATIGIVTSCPVLLFISV